MAAPWKALAKLLIWLGSPALADPLIVGRASVVDGDTIDIDGVRIRFSGIDAPESWQKCTNAAGMAYSCGRAAAATLEHIPRQV